MHITYNIGAALFLHDDHGDGRLKIGRDGWFGVGTEDIPSHKSFTDEAGTEYSDTGASAEVYTDPDLFEIGRVPPLSTVDPGDSLEHTVTGRS